MREKEIISLMQKNLRRIDPTITIEFNSECLSIRSEKRLNVGIAYPPVLSLHTYQMLKVMCKLLFG